MLHHGGVGARCIDGGQMALAILDRVKMHICHEIRVTWLLHHSALFRNFCVAITNCHECIDWVFHQFDWRVPCEQSLVILEVQKDFGLECVFQHVNGASATLFVTFALLCILFTDKLVGMCGASAWAWVFSDGCGGVNAILEEPLGVICDDPCKSVFFCCRNVTVEGSEDGADLGDSKVDLVEIGFTCDFVKNGGFTMRDLVSG